jgi:hypothetical protein
VNPVEGLRFLRAVIVGDGSIRCTREVAAELTGERRSAFVEQVEDTRYGEGRCG